MPLFDPARPANVWKFDGGVAFDFPANTTLAANGYALVTQLDPAQFRSKYSIPASVPIFGPYTGSLNNAGEEISLVRPGEPELDGTVPYYVADRVDYLPSVPWPTGTAGTGATLSQATRWATAKTRSIGRRGRSAERRERQILRRNRAPRTWRRRRSRPTAFA